MISLQGIGSGLRLAVRARWVAVAWLLAGGAARAAGLVPDTGFQAQDGPALYSAICQGCHMPDAKGAVGAGRYPALAGNPRVGSAGYVVHNVLHGYHGMPGFSDTLNDQQVATVVNYVRTHFGNTYADAVTAEQVHQAR